jgi:hypothetical protein
MCSKYADCVVNGYQRQCKCKKGYYGNGQVCDKKDIEYPKPNPYPNGSNLNIYAKLEDGRCSLMGFDWENEKKLLATMKWSSNPKTFTAIVEQLMDEFASLGKTAIGRSIGGCDDDAGAVACGLLPFPHTEHRCQLVERIEAVYEAVAKKCNDSWKNHWNNKVQTLVNNNGKYKGGAACPKVHFLA